LGLLDFFFEVLVCDLVFFRQVIDLIFPSPVVIFSVHFDILFSVSVSVSVSLAVPRLLGDEIRIPSADVNKKVKKYFHPGKRFFFTPTASPRSRMNARSAGGRC
jgi:hypothetical protein